MDLSLITNLLVGLGGVISGAIVSWITLRKMPPEIRNTESQTLQNVLASNKLLSVRLQEQQSEIDELRGWFEGTLEIRTRIELSNPPRVITADIRRLEAAAPNRV